VGRMQAQATDNAFPAAGRKGGDAPDAAPPYFGNANLISGEAFSSAATLYISRGW
jgi:hypothetical protein